MADLQTTELDLHAFIDGRLADERRREVATYLDAHPDTAERIAAYVQQRDALALLGRCLAPEPAPARLAVLEAALLDAARRRCRARRTVATAGAVLLATAAGWAASGRVATSA
jgi:anti-sigma factor RsiW